MTTITEETRFEIGSSVPKRSILERGRADYGWLHVRFTVSTAGNLQYMRLGDGVRHSEFNPSRDEQNLLSEISLQPNIQGGEPRYVQKKLSEAATPDSLILLFYGDGGRGATVFGKTLKTGDRLAIEDAPTESPVAGVSPESRVGFSDWREPVSQSLQTTIP